MNLRTIIIEDEEPARILIKHYLKDQNQIEIIGEYSDGFSGLKAINNLKPDLVFLDIQMPKLTGFEILELIEHKPLIIFTTAYDQFAIQAFEANAIDYLLKPFTKERFNNSLEKVKEIYITKKTTDIEKVEKLITTVEEKQTFINRIAIKSNTKISVIPVESINFIEANGDYVTINTDENSFLKEKTMKFFEQHLDNSQFIRIHRSFIVNINQISKIEQYDKENHIVILKNNSKLKASINGYKELKRLLNL